MCSCLIPVITTAVKLSFRSSSCTSFLTLSSSAGMWEWSPAYPKNQGKTKSPICCILYCSLNIHCTPGLFSSGGWWSWTETYSYNNFIMYNWVTRKYYLAFSQLTLTVAQTSHPGPSVSKAD